MVITKISGAHKECQHLMRLQNNYPKQQTELSIYSTAQAQVF